MTQVRRLLRHKSALVGVDLAGDEAGYPAALFAPAFRLAREAGLPATVHAGEAAGPRSVWDALRLGPQRIGHGVRSAGDPRLLEHLAASGVTLEVAITSASFWARRMAHETAVHRADAELAAGLRPTFAPDLGADAVDEWLGFLCGPAPEERDPRLEALPDGAVLHVHATDDGLGGDGEWTVRREDSQVLVEHGHGKGDVAVRGPAGSLLLVLVRRVPPDDPQVQVLGDRALLDRWLAATPF